MSEERLNEAIERRAIAGDIIVEHEAAARREDRCAMVAEHAVDPHRIAGRQEQQTLGPGFGDHDWYDRCCLRSRPGR
jgi:dihydroxyacetone kinase